MKNWMFWKEFEKRLFGREKRSLNRDSAYENKPKLAWRLRLEVRDLKISIALLEGLTTNYLQGNLIGQKQTEQKE